MQSDWTTKGQEVAERALEEFKVLLGSPGWNIIEDKEGVITSTQTSGDHYYSKTMTDLKASPNDIIRYYTDLSNCVQWNPKLQNLQVIHEAGDLRLIKIHMKNKWPMEDREMIYVSKVFTVPNGPIYLIEKSIDLNNYPTDKKHIRGFYHGGYLLESKEDGTTRLTFIATMDPKGNVMTAIKHKIVQKQNNRLKVARTKFNIRDTQITH